MSETFYEATFLLFFYLHNYVVCELYSMVNLDIALTFLHVFGKTYNRHNLQQLTPPESQLVSIMHLCIKWAL